MHGNRKKDIHKFMEDTFTYKGTTKREENCASDEQNFLRSSICATIKIACQKHEGTNEPFGGFRCDISLDMHAHIMHLLSLDIETLWNMYTILKICG